MLEQLKVNKSKKIILELTNGRTISGTVSSVDQEFVRFDTDDGVGIIPLNNIQIIWEPITRSLTEENMEVLAQKLRDKIKIEIACTGAQFTCSQQYICRPPDTCTGAFACPGSYVPFQGGSLCPVAFACTGTQFYGFVGPQGSDPQAEIACTGFPAFTCSQRYICRPPDICTFTFACPGSYVPGTPSGGGGCPIFFCGPFQFGQPCRPFTFGCGPFQFGQPCGPFTFGGCGPFQFGLPCGNFPFGGSTCGTLGGFACPGQQFIGIAPGEVASNLSVDNDKDENNK